MSYCFSCIYSLTKINKSTEEQRNMSTVDCCFVIFYINVAIFLTL